ncbi:PilZ domain-containing protein [Vogesella fluminis]|uniref:Cyclic di-GMP receptor atypical PilZ domain-containing protein n=1 Tax=Vogesella fluminis TaxID=1069161 RepID=A0ABQ3HBQ2_9NEIS|nr:PilZ domain-containing protein [Vogesella fluminis]GHD77063.1 hypothetical protein GCM10011419_17320 [Vogesella fluminis]
MPLPELDTVSFDSCFPLRFHPAPDAATRAAAQLETGLALAVLAAPQDQDSDGSPLLQRLEAKLDFVLELGLLARYPQLPPPHPCRIGLEAVIWQDEQPASAGDSGLLQLHPHAPSGYPLYLFVTIAASEARPDGHRHLARLQPLHHDNDTRRWERWVFQQHRQHIGKGKA